MSTNNNDHSFVIREFRLRRSSFVLRHFVSHTAFATKQRSFLEFWGPGQSVRAECYSAVAVRLLVDYAINVRPKKKRPAHGK